MKIKNKHNIITNKSITINKNKTLITKQTTNNTPIITNILVTKEIK